MNGKLVYGNKLFFVRLKLGLVIFGIALKAYKNLTKAIKALRFIFKLRRNVKGNYSINKMIKFENEFYSGPYIPPFNSKNYKHFIKTNLNHFSPFNSIEKRLNHIFLAITKKCPLHCEHCFEWGSINGKDVLDKQKIDQILTKLDPIGYNQLIITGGEPLTKLDLVTETIENVSKKVHCWIYTSGYNFNQSTSLRLKKAGLTGVFISIDDYREAFHNNFRGHKKAFKWALEAIENAKKNNLLICLSLCVTKNLATEEHLKKYMRFAKESGVHFVQILEPKPIGRYNGKDVKLLPEHYSIIEDIYLKYNSNKEYKDYPIIVYHGFHQRRIGCFNSGFLSVYIDTNGAINSCPFCRIHNQKTKSYEENINQLVQEGCQEYKELHI